MAGALWWGYGVVLDPAAGLCAAGGAPACCGEGAGLAGLSFRGAVSLHVGSVRNKSCPFRDAGPVLWSFGLLKNN